MSHIRCSLVHERALFLNVNNIQSMNPESYHSASDCYLTSYGGAIEPDLAQCLIAMIAEFAAPGEVIMF